MTSVRPLSLHFNSAREAFKRASDLRVNRNVVLRDMTAAIGDGPLTQSVKGAELLRISAVEEPREEGTHEGFLLFGQIASKIGLGRLMRFTPLFREASREGLIERPSVWKILTKRFWTDRYNLTDGAKDLLIDKSRYHQPAFGGSFAYGGERFPGTSINAHLGVAAVHLGLRGDVTGTVSEARMREAADNGPVKLRQALEQDAERFEDIPIIRAAIEAGLISKADKSNSWNLTDTAIAALTKTQS